MKKLLPLLLMLSLGVSSCKKDVKYCWQMIDCTGQEMGKQCSMTETEVQDYADKHSYPTCKMTYKKAQ